MVKFNRFAELVLNYISSGRNVFFLTLTYRDNVVYESKYVLSDFIKSLKKHYYIDGYLWVREFQKRGAVHYHILVLSPAKYLSIELIDKKWHRGFTFIKNVDLSTVDNVVRYVFKYMEKGFKDKKQFIYKGKRLRAWGRGGSFRDVDVYSSRYDRIMSYAGYKCVYHSRLANRNNTPIGGYKFYYSPESKDMYVLVYGPRGSSLVYFSPVDVKANNVYLHLLLSSKIDISTLLLDWRFNCFFSELRSVLSWYCRQKK